MRAPIPIYILGGSDNQPGPVPKDLQHSQMLRGFKGAIALPSGQCLAQELINRIRASGLFADPVIIGPGRVYREIVDCRIVDVEGNLANTLDAVRQEVRQQSDQSQPVAFISCDILPTADEFQALLNTHYLPCEQCCLWGQFIAVEPEAMGESAWKPSYQFPPDDGCKPRTMYPGHLVIARPAALRMRLMNHLLKVAYQHRNLSLMKRPIPMFFRGIGRLIREDFRNLWRGQLPILAISIPCRCLIGFLRFQRRRLSVTGFARIVTKTLLHRDHQHGEHPPVVFSIASIESFAKDIDTEDELAELTKSFT